MIKDLMRYFFQGLIYTAPVAIIVYVFYQLFTGMRDMLHAIGLHVHPLVDPLIGIFFFLLIIVIIGVLGSSIFFRPLFSWIDLKLEKTPVIKTLYTSVKDVMNAIMGSKKRFNQPVMVRLHVQDELERIGFITTEDLTDLGVRPGKVAVYLPFSYAISGVLYIVPADRVRPLDAAPADVMKFVLSGGVTVIAEEHNQTESL